MVRGDAARLMASAVAMHTSASGTPKREMFGLQRPFPGAGVGPFPEAQRRKPPRRGAASLFQPTVCCGRREREACSA